MPCVSLFCLFCAEDWAPVLCSMVLLLGQCDRESQDLSRRLAAPWQVSQKLRASVGR